MSGYVGADAQRLTDLRSAVADATGDVAARRARIAALFAASGEADAVSPTLAAVEAELSQAGGEIAAAAEVAAADAAAGGQTGWRASLGLVDDVLADVFFVNDLNRALAGRDINTGTDVGTGERVASGIFLIPFAKLAKAAKLLKFGDDAAGAAASSTGAARRAARAAVTNSDDVRAFLRSFEPGVSRSGRVFVVESQAALDEALQVLTAGATRVPHTTWPTWQLPDGTIVRHRSVSSSGGETIDVRFTTSRHEWKLHITR